MKTILRLFLTIIALLLATNTTVAQDKPRWAKRGVKSINNDRNTDTYEFAKFETFNPSIATLRSERYEPLKEYLAKQHGLNADDATVREVNLDYREVSPNQADAVPVQPRDVEVIFGGDTPQVFKARMVDDYVSFDDNVDESYDYTLYQLYQVGTSAGVDPVYDNIKFSRAYRGQALIRSIVPGFGQIYKDQYTKAAWIIGGEVVCIGTAIWCDVKHHKFAEDAKRYEYEDIIHHSYRSKARSWRNFRNIAIVGAVGIYVVNLVDAAVSKGPRQVIVKKPKGTQVALGPSVLYDPSSLMAPAVGMSFTF